MISEAEFFGRAAYLSGASGSLHPQIYRAYNLNPTTNNAPFTVPDARKLKTGVCMLLVVNLHASNALLVKDQSSNTIATVPAQRSAKLYLRDNTTLNGTWNSKVIQHNTAHSHTMSGAPTITPAAPVSSPSCSYYRLISCNATQPEIFTATDLSSYINVFIKVLGNWYWVTRYYGIPSSAVAVTVQDSGPSCPISCTSDPLPCIHLDDPEFTDCLTDLAAGDPVNGVDKANFLYELKQGNTVNTSSEWINAMFGNNCICGPGCTTSGSWTDANGKIISWVPIPGSYTSCGDGINADCPEITVSLDNP